MFRAMRTTWLLIPLLAFGCEHKTGGDKKTGGGAGPAPDPAPGARKQPGTVDNGGGGIFEFLPQAQRLDRGAFELLVGTGQNVDIVALSRALGFDAAEISGREELAAALRAVPVGPRVIVVRTDRVANVGVHNEIYAAVSRAVLARGAVKENA